MPETITANLSQEYIDHLKQQTALADDRQKELQKDYDFKNRECQDAQTWQDQIAAFWTRIKKTEALSQKIFLDIDILLDQAQKVNRNIEYTLQAVKILVCNVREVSRVLEQLNGEYQELKFKIDTASTRDKSFTPGKIMEAFKDLGTRLDVAVQASETAIDKVLDLLKAVYVLHRTFDSERNVHHNWIISNSVVSDYVYVDENQEMPLIVLHEEVTISHHDHTVYEPGLEWNVLKLRELLEAGMPQPGYDRDGYPCQDTVYFVPTFPLDKGINRYYDITKRQFEQAEDKTNYIRAELTEINRQKLHAESKYAAYNAAYNAAKEAKQPA